MVDNLTWGATTGAQSGGIGALGSLSQNGVSVGRSMGEIGAQEMMAQNLYRSQTQAYQDLISAGAAASSVPKPVQERAIGSAEEYNQKIYIPYELFQVLPAFETVKRMRAYIQNKDGLWPPTDPDVRDKRTRRAATFRAEMRK